MPDPTSSELVKATMRGIRRSRLGFRGDAVAKPLVRDDLSKVLDVMGSSLADCRDRALLTLGFAGALRRSELVGLDVRDLAAVSEGLVVTLRRSKTDRLNEGRQLGIPHGHSQHCPVTALNLWLGRSAIVTGPLFRPINRGGSLSDKRLSGEAVSLIIKQRLAAAGIDPTGYSGHSLRAGFATTAAVAGAPLWKIRMQTRHVTDQGVARYIRTSGLFAQNAAADLLIKPCDPGAKGGSCRNCTDIF
ncbi:site-specific integrase [Hyphomicrobium sp. 99]|uniref:site-specific integrase n=1 Tax=Hyphomicrobium sp. 99 TaxID=1163419 RepID=UPI001FD89940|nr:site-specific integrase [Hyphomicrobium sp. 99]